MEPTKPFVFRVTETVVLCDRVLLEDDRVTVYPGQGIYPVLAVPANYGAIAGALAEGSLEPATPGLSLEAFSAAVGLEPPAAARQLPERSRARWGAKLRRERTGLRLEK